MKKLLSVFVFIATLASCFTIYAQAPLIEWQKSLGGSNDEEANSILQTADGKFIIAGLSKSNDFDVSGNHGDKDYWIVKTDTYGTLIWQRSLGGSNNDEAHSIQPTSDGGFIVSGLSASNDNDVSENHGEEDYWLVKLDATGQIQWQKSLGGSDLDKAHMALQTFDGGYIVAGSSYSNDGNVTGNHGLRDYWIAKTDTAGNLLWQISLGGSDHDKAHFIQQTSDSGFIVCGVSYSIDGDITGNHGLSDYWIVKLNMNGSLEWQKTLGGSSHEEAFNVRQTTDGGYIIAGWSSSNDGDVSGNHGGLDCWVVKLGATGNLVWQKSLGGSGDEQGYCIQECTGGGFIVTGWSTSNDGDVSGNHGANDYWIAKLDAAGNLVWQESLGGSSDDFSISLQQTSDDGFIVAGYSASNDFDVTGNHGGEDYWVVKLSPDITTNTSLSSSNSISLSPNPTQSQLTINLATPANQVTIRVYDLQGREMNCESQIANNELNSIQLNTEKLPDGFYTLQIINNETGRSEVGKFVKQ